MKSELLELVLVVSEWHEKKIANLRDVQEGTKEGTTLEIGTDETRKITLTARDAAMFGLGLEAALIELGTLPFTFKRVDAEGQDDSEEDSAASAPKGGA